MIDLNPILERAVTEGRAPGLVAGVIDAGGRRSIAAAGLRGVDNPAPMSADTLFSIASCTKAITSVAALQLVERGLLHLDEPVGERLPALAAPRVLTGFEASGAPITRPARGAITLRRLLTHTSGLAYDFNSAEISQYLSARGEVLMGAEQPNLPLMFDPGEGWLYGIGIDWAGRLIEAASGQTLDAYVDENILAPLGMKDTSYFPGPELSARKASVHQKTGDGAFIAIPFGMPPVRHFMMGGAGLYSTVGDYLTFLASILAGGAPLLKAGTFELMMGNHVGDLDAGALKSANPLLVRDYDPLPGLTRRHGLAGLINLDPVPGGRAAGSLAWAGIANCYYWADPASGRAGVLMAQVLPFGDPGIIATFDEIERAAYAQSMMRSEGAA